MPKLNVSLFPAFVLLLFSFLAAPLAYAIPLGSVLTDFGTNEGARAVAIRPDGKIIAAGYSYNNPTSGFALARYHPDGRLDTTFGNNGFVSTTDFLGDEPEGMEVKLQSDGKIVIAGFAGTALNFAMARYTENGVLDSSFGTNGKVMTNLTGNGQYDLAYTMAIQADGKIVLGGFCVCTTTTIHDFALVRYNPNGTLDATFGSGGVVLTDFNNGSDDRINAFAVLADGKILAGGRTQKGRSTFGMARYNVNGTLDTTFGTGGLVTYDDGLASGEIRALQINSRGKILAVGPGGVNYDFTVVRFNADGGLDTRFANNGVAYADLGGGEQASAAILQADGKLLVGGYSNNDFAVARFNENGSLDGQFGTDGKVSTYLGRSNDFTVKLGMALQSDGKIVTAGTVGSNNSNFGLIRYSANGTLDTSFGPRADLVISAMSVSPASVKAGENITYTFTVTNQGPDTAPTVSIANQYSLSANTVSCTSSCNLGPLVSGASVAVVIVATPLQTGILTGTVSVNSINVPDPVTINNSASATVTVNGTADLSIAMTASPNPAKIGQPLTFVTTITNNGPDKATLVSLSNSLAGTATASQGSCAFNTTTTPLSTDCTLGTINPGATATVNLQITPSANGTITNNASVTTGVNDPSVSNNGASASATVNSNSDLAINVTAAPSSVHVGSNTTYTVTVTNHGPDEAVSVLTVNNLSNGATVLGFGTCPGGNYSPGFIFCTFPSINSGASVSYSFDASTSATGTIDGSHWVRSDTIPDPDSTNNETTSAVTVTGAADLSLTISDSPDPLMIGNNLTYTITITNRGPDMASGTSLSLYLPPQSRFVSSVSSQGSCSEGGSPSTCYLGNINSGASVIVTYVITPLVTGTHTVSGGLTSNIADPNPSDNNATASTLVNGTADLSISVTDSPDPVRVGSTLTYTTVVTNNGPDPVPVELNGSNPFGTANVVKTITQGTCSEYYYPVICDLGLVASGASVTMTLTGTAVARGTLTFSPTASTGATDPNSANNTATASTTVK